MEPYLIENGNSVFTKHGESKILTFKNKMGESVKVWACSGLLNKEDLEGQFIVNTGLKQSKTTGHKYHGYLLM